MVRRVERRQFARSTNPSFDVSLESSLFPQDVHTPACADVLPIERIQGFSTSGRSLSLARWLTGLARSCQRSGLRGRAAQVRLELLRDCSVARLGWEDKDQVAIPTL